MDLIETDQNHQQTAQPTGIPEAAPAPMPNLPRCGAPTRKDGQPCQALAFGPSGRCGGHQPPPQTVEAIGQTLDLDDLDNQIASTEGRRRVLAAVVRALAAGRCSTATANALVNAVKAASEAHNEKLQRALDEALAYAQTLEEQLGGVTSRGRL